jgi:antitoxin PrlF
MYKAKITSKGPITIPVEVRRAMGIKPGGKVAFFEGEKGEFVVRPVKTLRELRKSLAGLIPPMTVEEMDKAIGEAVTENYVRSAGELRPKKHKDEAA